MLDFYNRIDFLLKNKKATQKDLVNYLGLSSIQIYSNWKQRDSIPSADIAVKIARFLETSVEYLITGNDENPLTEKNEKLERKLEDIKKIIEA
jgi:transcriptional regulator with XRE-family HTH domain